MSLLFFFTSCLLTVKGLENNRSNQLNQKEVNQKNIKNELPKIPSKSQNSSDSQNKNITLKNQNSYPDSSQQSSQKNTANKLSDNFLQPNNEKSNIIPDINSNPDIKPIETSTLEIFQLGSFTIPIIENDTAFSILERTAQNNSFMIKYKVYGDLGAFIECINGICNGENGKYWMLYYNNELSPVGASLLKIKNNNINSWRFEKW